MMEILQSIKISDLIRQTCLLFFDKKSFKKAFFSDKGSGGRRV
jgi:hypothetical protein